VIVEQPLNFYGKSPDVSRNRTNPDLIVLTNKEFTPVGSSGAPTGSMTAIAPLAEASAFEEITALRW
jgi:hypothetical protein